MSWADTASVKGWDVTRSILSQRVIELKPTLKCSERWWSAFLRRNPNLQRKKNVGMEGLRASALNAPNISRWTTLLAETIDRLKLSASQIFNMDETNFSFDLVVRCKCNLMSVLFSRYVYHSSIQCSSINSHNRHSIDRWLHLLRKANQAGCARVQGARAPLLGMLYPCRRSRAAAVSRLFGDGEQETSGCHGLRSQ